MIGTIYHILVVAWRSLRSILALKFSRADVVKQSYEFGNKCLGLIAFCISFVGIIVILEYSHHIKIVLGSDSMVPSFVSLLLIRELAPVVAGLLLASKMGASITAELAAMRTTEQLDAFRLLGINPIHMFVAPRVIASALTAVLLTFIGLFCAILGAWISAVWVLDFTTGTYFQNLFVFCGLSDLWVMAFKSFCFGASIPVISAAFGFRCKFGAEGVGIATTNAVVTNSIWIIVLDFVLTYVSSAFL